MPDCITTLEVIVPMGGIVPDRTHRVEPIEEPVRRELRR